MELSVEIRASQMAKRMRQKLEKYWMEEDCMNLRMNPVLYIAALLDPRQKMKHVEKCLKAVYNQQRANEMVAEVRSTLDELFEFYKRQHMPPPQTPVTPSDSDTSSRSNVVDMLELEPPYEDDLFIGSSTILHGDQDKDEDTSEIVLYFTEKLLMLTASELAKFDVLQWWSLNSPRFPVLSKIAKDVLAIPISSVASECAFSTGGRVLSPFRSSLTPEIVQALICAEDWLRSSLTNVNVILKDDEEDVSEDESREEYERVIREFCQRAESAQASRTGV